MHIITVDSQKTKIMEAVHWARDEFGPVAFVVSNMFPNNFWNFEFKKSQDAMVFALKWQQ